MKYMGSKNRIAKHLLPIILKDKDKYSLYWEPFVGGGNIIDKVSGIYRMGTDIDLEVIMGLVCIKDMINLIPKNNKEFTEDDYKRIRKEGGLIVGYVAYALSYGGKKWGGWCRDSKGARDYVAEAYRNAIKQNVLLQNNIDFHCGNYYEFEDISNAIIYCDPPYKNTTKYKNQINYEHFHNWCREQHKKGNKIFVSEYEMPDDFKCVWEGKINSSLTKNTGSKKGIERLFTLENTQNIVSFL